MSGKESLNVRMHYSTVDRKGLQQCHRMERTDVKRVQMGKYGRTGNTEDRTG